MIHPCSQEHPYVLAQCPRELISAWWQDAIEDDSADAPELLEALYAIPRQRDAA